MRKKWIDKVDESKKKRSRAKYKCSEPLSVLINYTNRLSDEGELPEINFFINQLKAECPQGIYERFTQEERTEIIAEEIIYTLIGRSKWLIMDILNRASELTGETVGRTKEGLFVLPPSICIAFLNIYQGIKNDIENFIKFSQVLNEVRLGIREKYNLGSFSLKATPIFSENNKIKIESKSILFDSIDDIYADRLRICGFCNHIFWAKKNNSLGCTESCVDALYQRTYRKNDEKRELINKQRRLNRYRQDSIPYCEKCSHPHTKCRCYENERSKK